jgi:hypothetical protein
LIESLLLKEKVEKHVLEVGPAASIEDEEGEKPIVIKAAMDDMESGEVDTDQGISGPESEVLYRNFT